MKKYLYFLLLAVILILGACGQGEVSTEKNNNEENTTTEQGVKSEAEENGEDNEAVTEETETDEQTGNEEAESEVGNEEIAAEEQKYSVQYDTDKQSVQLVKPDGTTEVLAERSASEPVLSPDGKKAAYVSSIEWEELSDVYIINLEDGAQTSLVSSEEQQKPKKVLWENDENVFVLIGQAYGTVGVGGNIYKVNLETKEKTPVTNYEDDIQITDFKIENGTLKYSGIKYTDDIMNEYVEYENEISL